MSTVAAFVLAFTMAGSARAQEKPAAPAAAAPAVKAEVSRSALCTAVKDREPVDAAASDKPAEFKASIGSVYFWTEMKSKSPVASLKHVWYRGGEKVAEVELVFTSPRTRTWSRKSVYAGDWKVEALDDSGAVLASALFKVVP